jgi:hypothetical protein
LHTILLKKKQKQKSISSCKKKMLIFKQVVYEKDIS